MQCHHHTVPESQLAIRGLVNATVNASSSPAEPSCFPLGPAALALFVVLRARVCSPFYLDSRCGLVWWQLKKQQSRELYLQK